LKIFSINIHFRRGLPQVKVVGISTSIFPNLAPWDYDPPPILPEGEILIDFHNHEHSRAQQIDFHVRCLRRECFRDLRPCISGV
jgi:hypothetical protein